MARMSKEAYLRQMERVNDPDRSEQSYRVPPPVWEKPEEYLTPSEKRECAIMNGVLYGGLCVLALGAIGIGSCIYNSYTDYQKKHDKTGKLTRWGYKIESITNQQTTKQRVDLQRLNPLKKRVLAPRINNTVTRPLHRTRNNQQLPNKNIAYPRFYHITSG